MVTLSSDRLDVLRRLILEGHSVSFVARVALSWVSRHEIGVHFRAAFGLSIGDVSCLGGWIPDGSGEISDASLNAFIVPSIVLNRTKWLSASEENCWIKSIPMETIDLDAMPKCISELAWSELSEEDQGQLRRLRNRAEILAFRCSCILHQLEALQTTMQQRLNT